MTSETERRAARSDVPLLTARRSPAVGRRTPRGPVGAVLLAAALVVGGLLFTELVTLLLAITMAVLLAIPLAAAADRLERLHVPRSAGVLVTLLAVAGILAALAALIVPAFAAQAQRFIDQVPDVVASLQRDWQRVSGAQPGDLGDRIQSALRSAIDDPLGLIGPLASIGLGIVGVLAACILIVMAAYYMAVNPEPLVTGLLRLFPPHRRDAARETLGTVRRAWIGWMQGVGADMVVTGVLLYLGLTIIGVDFAVVFSVVAGLLVVVPYLGAFVSGLLPVLYASTQSLGHGALTLFVYLLVQQIEGHVVVPLIMARTVRLHPAAILVGVVIVGRLFGLVGLFIAVPLVSLAVILVRDLWIEPLERDDRDRGARTAAAPR